MTSNRYGRSSVEVRREYLKHGGDAAATARAIGMSRPAVVWHVKRANAAVPLPPLNLPRAIPKYQEEDAAAVLAGLRAFLDRVGVPTPAVPSPDREPVEDIP